MVKRYGFFGVVYIIYCKIRSFFINRNVRIIRFPIDIRNQHLISFGKGFTTGIGCRIEVEEVADRDLKEKRLLIGENVQINDYVHITASKSVVIGNNVLIASKVYISDCSHGSYSGDLNDSSPITSPNSRFLFSKAVVLEDNVWVGEFVSILPGVTIGSGSIIGANSVVTKSLPANIIAVGAPAKVIKKFNFETQRWESINSKI